MGCLVFMAVFAIAALMLYSLNRAASRALSPQALLEREREEAQQLGGRELNALVASGTGGLRALHEVRSRAEVPMYVLGISPGHGAAPGKMWRLDGEEETPDAARWCVVWAQSDRLVWQLVSRLEHGASGRGLWPRGVAAEHVGELVLVVSPEDARGGVERIALRQEEVSGALLMEVVGCAESFLAVQARCAALGWSVRFSVESDGMCEVRLQRAVTVSSGAEAPEAVIAEGWAGLVALEALVCDPQRASFVVAREASEGGAGGRDEGADERATMTRLVALELLARVLERAPIDAPIVAQVQEAWSRWTPPDTLRHRVMARLGADGDAVTEAHARFAEWLDPTLAEVLDPPEAVLRAVAGGEGRAGGIELDEERARWLARVLTSFGRLIEAEQQDVAALVGLLPGHIGPPDALMARLAGAATPALLERAPLRACATMRLILAVCWARDGDEAALERLGAELCAVARWDARHARFLSCLAPGRWGDEALRAFVTRPERWPRAEVERLLERLQRSAAPDGAPVEIAEAVALAMFLAREDEVLRLDALDVLAWCGRAEALRALSAWVAQAPAIQQSVVVTRARRTIAAIREQLGPDLGGALSVVAEAGEGRGSLSVVETRGALQMLDEADHDHASGQ